ncbi:MAG: hypothetical protein IPL55_07290 [Saprospiraceae bacterium]|jgi:hypothetical protein|nr:hypothetical protein [Saprospiraceae bacterium]
MEKSKQIGFQIKAIELIDSSFTSLNKPRSENPNFQFEINLEHRISQENHIIVVICSINVFMDSKENMIGTLKASCVYQVESLSSYFDKKKKVFNLPDQFINTINSISISTTRGIMFTMFKGTNLHNAILPIVNPSSFSNVEN